MRAVSARPDTAGRWVVSWKVHRSTCFSDPDELRARITGDGRPDAVLRSHGPTTRSKLAVDATVASIGGLELTGSSDEQAMQVRDAIRVVFPGSDHHGPGKLAGRLR